MSEEQPYYPPIPDDGYNFVDALGLGFATGLAGSSILGLFGGLLRRGGGGLAGAARAVGARAPRGAGTLAAYFGLCSALESAISLARPNKEDLWNGAAAAAVSWAVLGVRRGAAGAAILAAGAADNLADGRIPLLDKPRRQPAQPQPAAPVAPGFLGVPQGPPIVVEEVSVDGDERL
ncbi:hypothetical protein BDA96_01G360500 [Sorghum bicolor]|uniref:Uncharacterized protein n=2 Tax=Sorghum bicolor TaxID=4558 RepID=A0A921UZX4_SORBI|nr:hypothetical protein BDA96_01G360500 [Sorghum bicolor]KXG39136.1 hypothetical protein SORBI_3001G336900 [Sorghum bicolor]